MRIKKKINLEMVCRNYECILQTRSVAVWYVYYVWSLEIYNWTIGSPIMSEGKKIIKFIYLTFYKFVLIKLILCSKLMSL